MSTNQIHILFLNYTITFDDADDGECYAGEGQRLLSVHQDLANAQALASEFNSVVSAAEKETIVFPVQKNNMLLKEKFGFTLDDIDNARDFKLVVETYDVETP